MINREEKAKKKRPYRSKVSLEYQIKWRPQRDLNPRRRRERAVSWAGLDDRDIQENQCNGELTWIRTMDPHIKSVLLYQLSYEPTTNQHWNQGYTFK